MFFFKISRYRIKVAENKYLLNSQGIRGDNPNILAKTSNEDKQITNGIIYLLEPLKSKSDIILFIERKKNKQIQKIKNPRKEQDKF